MLTLFIRAHSDATRAITHSRYEDIRASLPHELIQLRTHACPNASSPLRTAGHFVLTSSLEPILRSLRAVTHSGQDEAAHSFRIQCRLRVRLYYPTNSVAVHFISYH